MWTQFSSYWPHLVALLHICVGAATSAHAVLYKRDARSAVSWAGLIWLSPFIGSLLYIVFGVNRIRRRAQSLRADTAAPQRPTTGGVSDDILDRVLGPSHEHLRPLVRLGETITARPLLGGNRIEPLENGDEAFPAMLRAIEQAERSVALSTYIFDNDAAGRTFLDALAKAVRRGAQVRVLIDSVGARYTWPSMVGLLRKAGIPVATFMPTLMPWRFRYSNLRSHRKILVIDGRVGFTGGMNIREGNLLATHPAEPIQDLHFRLEGPVVAHLQECFAVDWNFCTEETLEGELWFPPLEPAEPLEVGLARGIADGPDEDYDKLRLTLLGAIGCAKSSLRIMTPYFLPDAALVSALNVAAMRGVQLEIILPRVNNLKMVQWASTALLWQVLQRGCCVWLSPPPFDHTKLMLVDDLWTLIGSANWDARSLRLNFEFNVECYDRPLAARMRALFHRRRESSQPISLADVDHRPLPIRLRDGIVRLASPYL